MTGASSTEGMGPHLSDAELAQLAELGRQDLPDRVRAHLERCARCVAALAEVAEARKRWGSGTLEASPESWAAAGKSIAGRGARPYRPKAALAVGVLAPAMIAGILWLGRGSMRAVPDVPPEVRATIARSAGAGLVLPGFEEDSSEGDVVLRGNETPALRGFVDKLEAEVRATGATPERAYLLAAAALAEGRLNAARAHADAGRRLAPDDVRLIVASAVVAYRESDLERAKKLLEEAGRRAPGDAVVRENLIVVERAIGESPDEGRGTRVR